MVGTTGTWRGSPAASDAMYGAAFAACTPTMRSGRPSFAACCFAALAMPAARPPPPMGTTIVVASGACSRISRPSVPWPAMTSGWSNGGIITAPDSAANASAASMVSPIESPTSTTSAPYARVASSLGSATPTGMKIVARMPSSRAA